MKKMLNRTWHKILRFLHLSPLSLAEKCRIAFGAAVIFILASALLLPYIWMGQLTKKAALDSSRAKAFLLQRQHFQLDSDKTSRLPPLGHTGSLAEPNTETIKWIRLDENRGKNLEDLTSRQRRIIEQMQGTERKDRIFLTRKDGKLYSRYIKLFEATENCISCHNQQGAAKTFSRNQPVGAAVIERPAGEIRRMVIMNKVWIIIAGLIGGAGAIVAFYLITQRVILRPIRQLRALANNVAEGNLNIRSSIKTRDEYEKLAQAFNHMLDSLQTAQKKLRDANRKLDEKIAELSERNIDLFKANKVKSEFLANISHEFRTPLNTILGFAEILKDNPAIIKQPKNKRYIENIISSGKNLLAMIRDLLDLAKVEAGKMELHIEKTSVPQLCRSVVASFSSLTRRKKIKVKLSIDDGIDRIITDAGKVRQILYNFLSNATKFTPQRGRIEIKATMPDAQTVRLMVTDTGCGIAETDKEKIFEKFRQVDGSITRQSDGSGLGLAISKELATMLAGTVGMKSQIDKGSSFWVDIPVTFPEQKA